MKRFAWNAIAPMLLLLVPIFLQGCASGGQKPVEYSLHSVADANLNRDASGRPLSVVLAIYQLRDPAQFARLTFEQYVSSSDTTVLLDGSVIASDEVVVLPASREKVGLQLSPESTYIGVVAVYRNPAAQYWHYLVPANQFRESGFLSFSRQKQIDIQLHECHLSISGVVIEPIPGQRLGVDPVCGTKSHDGTDALVSDHQY